MTWEVSIKVTKREWLSNPPRRWNAGLQYAGLNFRQGLGRTHYPPISSPIYQRTYQTADRASFRIVEEGAVMEFGSTFYLPFILEGTQKWQGWPGTKDGLTDVMKQGFAYGIRNYSE